MTTTPEVRTVKVPQNYEGIAWKWMRISAFLLVPLVWGHLILQDVIVGVHAMNLGYVQLRWASLIWRVYDGLLLAFAFAHGMNGLRQVLFDYVHGENARRNLVILLVVVWLAITAFGFIALLGGVNSTLPIK
jgi:succinate dehydrogenase / fumarate reductase, membrane anchor subunit